MSLIGQTNQLFLTGSDKKSVKNGKSLYHNIRLLKLKLDKLPYLKIKVNCFDDFNKSVQPVIKPAVPNKYLFTPVQIGAATNLIHKGLNEFRREIKLLPHIRS